MPVNDFGVLLTRIRMDLSGMPLAVFFGGLVGAHDAHSPMGRRSSGRVRKRSERRLAVDAVVESGSGGDVTPGLLAYMSQSRGAGSWALDFGLQFEKSDWRGLLYGMGLQIAVTLLVLLPLAALLGLDDPPQQDVADIAGDAASVSARIGVLFVLVIIAPFSEELLFRGLLLSRLRRAMSPHSAIAISAALFASIHLIDPSAAFVVPGLFVIGLVLGYQSLRTGRIGLAITTHAGVNLLAAIALLLDVGV